jgi:hypothetical protein
MPAGLPLLQPSPGPRIRSADVDGRRVSRGRIEQSKGRWEDKCENELGEVRLWEVVTENWKSNALMHAGTFCDVRAKIDGFDEE